MHQAIKPVRRGDFCGVDPQRGIIALHQDEFLAPVAEDVAPERRAPAVSLMRGIRAVVTIDAEEAVGVAGGGVEFVDDRVQRAAARAVFKFARKVGVPPQGFGRPDGVDVNLRALAVVDAGLGGIHFAAAIIRVQVKRGAAAHVGERARIPFFEDAAGADINQCRGEQSGIVLLDRIHLQTGPVRVNVRDVKAVAMHQFRVEQRLAVHAVEGRADVQHVVNAVMVYIHDADLVAPGLVGIGRRRVKPAPRQLPVAIIIRHRLALERGGGVAVLAVN